MNTKYLWVLLVVLSFSSCKDEDDIIDPPAQLPELTAGNADFSNFVAIGNSLTAGFTDNALFIAGQENSTPNILSQQFALVGGGSFNQPLMNDNTGGMIIPGTDDLPYRLIFNGSGPQPLNEFLQSNGLPVPPVTTNVTENLMSTFNNMGVPGAKVGHLLFPGYAALNPYYARMATAPNATIIGDAMDQNPTFFSLWIGNNDVLGYALSGGDGTNPITDIGTFTAAYNTLIQTLSQGERKGVIANIPSVTTIPHFTTVPHNPVPLDGATAAILNSVGAYGAYNAGLDATLAFLIANPAQLQFFFPASENMTSQQVAEAEIARRKIQFSASETNAVVIFDENLTDLTAINPGLLSMRQATADDLLVLPASSFIGTEVIPGNPQTVNGVTIPLADKWVLTPEEQAEIATATSAFNQVINSAATQHNLAFVDTNALMQQLSSGNFVSGNFNPSSSLVLGGVFSLDGVHPNSRGYALIANEFLKAIDNKYESNFEASGNLIDIGNYPTNYSPTLQ